MIPRCRYRVLKLVFAVAILQSSIKHLAFLGTFRGNSCFKSSHKRSVVRSAWLEASAMGLWESYETLLDSQGVLTDVATAATLNVVSDSIAQTTEAARKPGDFEDPGAKFQLNWQRSLRYAVFGSYDGFAGHHWFEFLDSTLPKSGNGIFDTFLKVLSDSLAYTPCWCLVFLFSMAIMEGRSAATAIQDTRRDFFDLLKGNYGITLPFVALIYGSVPVRFQVAGFQALTLAYTIVLSLWANARQTKVSNQ